MFNQYRSFSQRRQASSVFSKRLTTAFMLLMLLKAVVSFAQTAATVTVSSTQAGTSTRYMGVQGSNAPGETNFTTAITDLGVNTFRYFTTMDRYEPGDDVAGYGYPTKTQLLAASASALLSTNTLIDWSKYGAELNKDRGAGQTDAKRFQMFKANGVRVVANLQLNQRGPDWAPTFATAPTQADQDEWWQFCYATVLLLNKQHDYQIDDWEIGNEPDLKSEGFQGTLSTYYQMVSIAKDAIRAAYSNYLTNRPYRIYAPAASSDKYEWINGIIQNVPNDFDHVTYHKYESYRGMVQSVQNVNSWAGTGREVWLTEWGTWWSGNMTQARNNDLSINAQWIKFIMNMSKSGNNHVDGWHYYKLYHNGSYGVNGSNAGDGLIDNRASPYTKEKMYYGLRTAIRALKDAKPVYEATASTTYLAALTTKNTNGTYNVMVTNTSSSTAFTVEINLSGLASNISQTTLYRFDANNNDSRFRGPVLSSTGRATVVVPPNGTITYVTASTTWSTDPADAQDNQAPSAVTGLGTSATTSTTTTLTWNPAADNVGAVAYNIYAGTALRTTVGGTSYTVTNLNAGSTYSYTVKALDGMGNESPASVISFTTVANGSVTGPASNAGDAHVQKGKSSENLGGEVLIKVKGSNNGDLDRRAYLKFNLTGVSAVKRAILRVYGSNKETEEMIRLSAFETSDSWAEGTITWDNAPAAIGTKKGEVEVTDVTQYWQMDVTDYVKAQYEGDKVVSFLLINVENQNQILEFNSMNAASNKPELIISSDAATVFQQSTATNGLVSMEAESYNSKTDRSSHAWTRKDDIASDSGPGAMQATPDNGMNITSSIVSTSPELGYSVNFVKTGTHYIWLRGYAVNSSAASAHTGLNGALQSNSDGIETTTLNSWVWIKDTRDGVRASVNVATTGVHTFNLWMREDGFVVDKIVLTTDANYVPSGTGPVESSKTSGARMAYGLKGAEEPQSVLDVYPVPATHQLTLSYRADRTGTVSISLSDARAATSVVLEKPVIKGNNCIRVNVTRLNSGLYLLRLNDGGKVQTRKVVISR
ncbi:MAG: DNRLRE domain-containing protein [Cytophagales bacterium]|nr:DNRLRE domain-containing protein [Cytophagales bacterium]